MVQLVQNDLYFDSNFQWKGKNVKLLPDVVISLSEYVLIMRYRKNTPWIFS
jgi:hypothetical protein